MVYQKCIQVLAFGYYRPMESSTTYAIVEALTKAIVEHRLHPGTKLAEQKLADHFGVSRTLVRQALFQLSQNRLIRLEPARGAFVAAPSVEEAQQRLVRYEFTAQALFRPAAQCGLVREAGVGNQEPGIARKRQRRAAILVQLLPRGDLARHRAGGLCHHVGARQVPINRCLRDRGLRHNQRRSQHQGKGNRTNHAGHCG